jgi:DNA-binding transcriptional regulator YiaG
MKGGSKYQPLLDYLRQSGQQEVTLSFTEIEGILGDRLPGSARRQRAWWSNRSKGALQATAWMGADYMVKQLDLETETVSFQRPPDRYVVKQVDGIVQWDGELIRSLRQHMGMTQQQFADELGVRQKTVSEWETGVYQPTRASSKHLMRVAQDQGFAWDIEAE